VCNYFVTFRAGWLNVCVWNYNNLRTAVRSCCYFGSIRLRWTQHQRHAMLDAAHIAGLKNPSIVSEAAAAALQLSHRYPPGPRGQKSPAPKTVAIVSVVGLCTLNQVDP
jgi:hypothetical protein